MTLRLLGFMFWGLVLLLPAGCTSETEGQSGSEVSCDPAAGGDAHCVEELGDDYICAQAGVCVLGEPETRARCGVALCDVPAPDCPTGTVPALDSDGFCYADGFAPADVCVPVEHCQAWPVTCTPGADGDAACTDAFGRSVACTQDGACAEARCSDRLECGAFGPTENPYECAGPNDAMVCGIPPQVECNESVECGAGSRCHSVADVCSLDGVGSSCGAPCTDGSCNDGFECNADGECVAILCDSGWTCPAHQECSPESIPGDAAVSERHHGCINIPCTDSCSGDLVCVNSFCQERIGMCEQPMLVP